MSVGVSVSVCLRGVECKGYVGGCVGVQKCLCVWVGEGECE